VNVLQNRLRSRLPRPVGAKPLRRRGNQPSLGQSTAQIRLPKDRSCRPNNLEPACKICACAQLSFRQPRDVEFAPLIARVVLAATIQKAPNLVVVNPRNGHAHLIYLLGGWIRTDSGDASRMKVVRYAAALGAGTAYSGRFHHNPLSTAYVTKVGRDAPYWLAELAQYVDLEKPAGKQARLGIGRNVEIFDRSRALGVHRDRRLKDRHARSVARDGRRAGESNCGRRRRRKPGRAAQTQRSRSHREERGAAVGVGAVRRRSAAPAARDTDRRAT